MDVPRANMKEAVFVSQSCWFEDVVGTDPLKHCDCSLKVPKLIYSILQIHDREAAVIFKITNQTTEVFFGLKVNRWEIQLENFRANLE